MPGFEPVDHFLRDDVTLLNGNVGHFRKADVSCTRATGTANCYRKRDARTLHRLDRAQIVARRSWGWKAHDAPALISSSAYSMVLRVMSGTAEHSRQLGDATCAVQRFDDGVVFAGFADQQMMLAARRNLRRVRHAQHLRARREAPQQATDYIGGGAADADVGLVEDQCRQLGLFGRDDLNREADPRTFAARMQCVPAAPPDTSGSSRCDIRPNRGRLRAPCR